MENSVIGWQHKPALYKLEILKKFACGEKALDIGCGMGWYSIYLADMGFDVVAIDRTKHFEDGRIQFIEMEINDILPFDDDSFDTVLLFDVLEHLSDDEALLREIERICRRIVIITVPNSEDDFLPYYGLTFSHRKDKSHFREYTYDDILGKVRNSNFKIEYYGPADYVNPEMIVEYFQNAFLRKLIYLVLKVFKKLNLLNYHIIPANIIVIAHVKKADQKYLGNCKNADCFFHGLR